MDVAEALAIVTGGGAGAAKAIASRLAATGAESVVSTISRSRRLFSQSTHSRVA